MRRDEVEDGMGFSGLAPTAAERAEERRLIDQWNAAIEAAARAVEKYGLDRINGMKDYPAAVASACSYHIRELKRQR